MISSTALRLLAPIAWGFVASTVWAAPIDPGRYDVLISGGTVYDGNGETPFVGDVAIQGDRIVYVGPKAPRPAREQVDARGKAVAPGFINMLAHPEASLLVDGRALSDLRQGVTLEVLGEASMGPLTPEMKQRMLQRQGDLHYTIDWTTLDEYLKHLERRGIAPNVASSSRAVRCVSTCWANVMCSQPRNSSRRCACCVHQAMEEVRSA